MSRTLRVVLKEDLPNLGDTGELVNVRPGYARNFLIPRGLAAVATRDNVKRIEHEKRSAEARAAKARAAAEALAKKVDGTRVTIEVKVGEENKMYGSVTSRDVEEALEKKGHTVDRRKIVMDPIKAIGDYRFSIKLAQSAEAEIVVSVVPAEASD
ncbi:MAG: 50S ribosomal protein L9 [Myxococcota bacterium]